MNYLAHAFLSTSDEILIGNFIGDSVKGKFINKYPEGISQGIFLHRAIDTYTDCHPTFRKSKSRLRAKYGLFSGILVDMFYDHFLAAQWSQYSCVSLTDFSSNTYKTIQKYHYYLPDKIKIILPYMISEDWLYSYSTFKGIQKSLIGINDRTRQRGMISDAHLDLMEYYYYFFDDFRIFFDDVRKEFPGNKKFVL
ncbi:MAG: ACP phosphodiesterase [Cytophagaceae bacterium]